MISATSLYMVLVWPRSIKVNHVPSIETSPQYNTTLEYYREKEEEDVQMEDSQSISPKDLVDDRKSYRPTEGEKLNVVQLLDNETSLDECANWDLMGNHLAAKEPKHIRAMYRNM
ncbi:hypothetical protein L484_014954 [Morus notabilis]|uniref:Uncharacterized protein n=1 Tax=Morus notabilis TaxID=981085 RepID=W9SI66_9ROSA|nr:hypothetical protein L484_014954 [Morus notabilis]